MKHLCLSNFIESIFFKNLIKNDNAYFSHSVALYLLGLTAEPPKEISIVTSKRKSSFKLEHHTVRFVNKKNELCNSLKNEIVFIKYKNTFIPVSSLELTLVDMASCLKYSPPISVFSQLFCIKSLDTHKLIKIAKISSDTTVKRVLFWLLWAGRISYTDIGKYKLSRTAINLVIDTCGSDVLVEPTVKVKYPRHILKMPRLFEPVNDVYTSSWINLINTKDFLTYCYENLILPIVAETRPRKLKVFANYHASKCIELDKKTTNENKHLILRAILSGKSRPPLPEIPDCSLLWLKKQPAISNYLTWLPKWLHTNAQTSDPKMMELVMFFGLNQEQYKLVEDLIANKARCLKASQFDILEHACNEVIKFRKNVSIMVYVNKARVLQKYGKYKESLELIINSQKQKHYSQNELAEISFVTSIAYMKLKQFDVSAIQIDNAYKAFKQSGNKEMCAAALHTAGNLFFGLNDLVKAKKKYTASFKAFCQLKKPQRQEPLLYNLALISLRESDYPKSAFYLEKAINISRKISSEHQLVSSLMSYGVLKLNMGSFNQAICALSEADKLNVKHSQISNVSFELNAYLAWAHKLAGNESCSNINWSIVDKALKKSDFNKSSFQALYMISMRHMADKKLHDAETVIESLLKNHLKYELSSIDIAGLHFRLAMIKCKLNKPGFEKLIESAHNEFKSFPSNAQFCLLKIYEYLYCRNIVTNRLPIASLKKLIKNNIYDPFIDYYLVRLTKVEHPLVEQFIKKHYVNKSCSTNTSSGNQPDITMLESHSNHCSNDVLTTKVSKSEYLRTLSEPQKELMIIDSISGQISIRDLKITMRPNSYPGKLLKKLLLSYPQPIDHETLFSLCWKTHYQPDIDSASLESAIYRLKKRLKLFKAHMQLIRKDKNLKLVFYCQWKAFVARKCIKHT